MNTTENSVKDEKTKVTDEQIGKLQRKTNEIIRRINEGTISYDDVLAGMQDIIEGKSKRLRLDLIPKNTKKWWEEKGVIYFKVISDGTTGEQWIKRLAKQGLKLSKYAKELLLSKYFKSTTGVEYTIAVLKGSLFTDSNRVTKKICSEAFKRKLARPNPEVACYIREMFSDEEIEAMGFARVMTFHKPIRNSDGGFDLLYADCDGSGFWLDTHYNSPDVSWGDYYGFAFEYSKQIA